MSARVGSSSRRAGSRRRRDATTPVEKWRRCECRDDRHSGVGVALLAVLVPVVVLQSRRLEQRLYATADALTATRTDIVELCTDLEADFPNPML